MLGSGEIVPRLLPIQTSLALLGGLALSREDECFMTTAMVHLGRERFGFARTIFKLLIQYGLG